MALRSGGFTFGELLDLEPRQYNEVTRQLKAMQPRK